MSKTKSKKTSLRDDIMATIEKLARNMGGGASKASGAIKKNQRDTKEQIDKAGM